MERIDDAEFDAMLEENIVFLSLKDAPAVTTMIECIQRNTPIFINRLKGLEEYLGKDYPGFYASLEEAEQKLGDLDYWVEKATRYLETLETKAQLTPEYFLQAFSQSSIYRALPIPSSSHLHEPNFDQYDVSVVMCSYKRLYNLRTILSSFCHQTFQGKFELVLWNNNFEEQHRVQQIADEFKHKLNLKVIHSTQNYYCVIRLAVSHLLMSPFALICDDDVIPGPSYIQFFMEKSVEYPNSVVCCRGHLFREHQLNECNPGNVWEDYQNLRFFDQTVEDRQVHFLHADNCLIPKPILQQLCQHEIPDPNFILVDDYWLSYVLSHRMKVPIWKVKSDHIFHSTPCADDESIALYHNPKVRHARIQFYIYHMRQGWPFSSPPQLNTIPTNNNNETAERKDKITYWDRGFHGFNIFSESSSQNVATLATYGASVVRIGAVGDALDLSYLVSKDFTSTQLGGDDLKRLRRAIQKMSNNNLKIILTLTSLPGRNFRANDIRLWRDQQLFSMIPALWGQLAELLKDEPNVIGYDIMNEPFTERDTESEPTEADPQQFRLDKLYDDCIQAIRKHDKETPIIVESSYWAHPSTLPYLKIFKDSRVVYSFHFYLPTMLTSRRKNNGFCQYPGKIPKWKALHSETAEWNKATIETVLKPIYEWQQQHGTRIFVGEFGISRDVKGASEYLSDLVAQFRTFGWSWCAYAFREEGWDAMDYELGTDATNMLNRDPNNELFQVLQQQLY
mmetsp:Transcript_22531/g.31374  ORF Transcript_22531/g.31374 Transcript_22531/m.31374 type:complete len:735 (-) Transcript_22531:1831-4035(-)